MKSISTRYHGPTDTRGSYILVSDGDMTMRVPYTHDEDPHLNAIRVFCRKRDWHGTLVVGGTKTGMVAVWSQDETITV